MFDIKEITIDNDNILSVYIQEFNIDADNQTQVFFGKVYTEKLNTAKFLANPQGVIAATKEKIKIKILADKQLKEDIFNIEAAIRAEITPENFDVFLNE